MADEKFRHQEVVTMGREGRLGIPIKVREALGISKGDKLNLIVEDNTIIIRVHTGRCIICKGPLPSDQATTLCIACRDNIIKGTDIKGSPAE